MIPTSSRALAAILVGAFALSLACTPGGPAGVLPPRSSPTVSVGAAAPTRTVPSDAASPGSPAGTAPAGDPAGSVPVGLICDRSGPTASVTATLCDGLIDWLDYANATGGARGRRLDLVEIDARYEVPLAVDAYKRMTTRDGIRMLIPFGTPFIDALAPASKEDRVILWSPGIGISATADGWQHPYVFVGVATYHAQAHAAMQYIADDWRAKGRTGSPRVIYLYYDNPAGRDPLDLIRRNAYGLDIVDTIGVPVTTVDMSSQLAIVKDQDPDYTIDHLFARTPPLALQAAEKVGFPRDRMIGLAWALSEDDVRLAGVETSEGALGVQFAAHPGDNPEALRLLEDHWKSAGRAPNPKSRETLHYNRGLLMGHFLVEAAVRADDPRDGDSLKRGIESFRDYTAHGLLAGTSITPEDHGGTRRVRMYQVRNGRLTMVRDWFEGSHR